MSHRLEVTYKGSFDTEKDAAIEKVIGKQSGASGYGFGERDLAFYFDKSKKGKTTKQCADEALAKLKSAKIHGVKGEVVEDKKE
jgi:hypothetical protein